MAKIKITFKQIAENAKKAKWTKTIKLKLSTKWSPKQKPKYV